MKKYIYKIGVFFLSLPFLGVTASCDDWFGIMPQSEMVAEDFWKDEQDVKSAVGACYRAMLEDGFMRRLVVWGELRSDNVIDGTSTDTEIGYILNANLNEANSYCKWNDFYTVINYCNTVIQNAPMVRERDADFTEEDLNHYLAEAKAIRAFCYFTLARTFKDIPYMETPYVDDTQRFQVGQTPFENVLDTLIRDLKTVENVAVTEYGENTAYTRGRVTQKAIWALIADMSLWKGDYQQCVDYCDKILTTTTNPLSLLPAASYFNSLIFVGNSDESIWELQYDNNTQNSAVRTFYGDNNHSCLLSAFSLETANGAEWWNGVDMRRIGAYAENSGTYYIEKYVYATYSTDYEDIRFSDFNSYLNGEGNWIIYRLADAYLMKAEALAELGDVVGAVDMVSYTYDRAHPNLDAGSLKNQYTASTPQATIRDLVLDERQREFLFEGKRYFDLVRRMRREQTATNVVNDYILRKYTSGMNLSQSTVMSKINDINAIYMPIHQDELRLNQLLEQNPFYETSDDISKN